MIKKILLLATVVVSVFVACFMDNPLQGIIKTGKPYIECIGAKTTEFNKVTLYFSEPVLSYATEPKQFALLSYLKEDTVLGVAQRETLSISMVSASNNDVTISTSDIMKVGKTYIVFSEKVIAKSSKALSAKDSVKFVAAYAPVTITEFKVLKDSSFNRYFSWIPNTKVGNTVIEIWKRSSTQDSILITTVDAKKSLYWHNNKSNQSFEAYAFKVVNNYGKTSMSDWVEPDDSYFKTFNCIGKDLTSLDAIPPGFMLVSSPDSLDRSAEYISIAESKTVIRKFIFSADTNGIVQITFDASIAPPDTVKTVIFYNCP